MNNHTCEIIDFILYNKRAGVLYHVTLCLRASRRLILGICICCSLLTGSQGSRSPRTARISKRNEGGETIDTSSLASIPTKQRLQVKVDNEIVMHFLLSFLSNLDFKPLFGLLKQIWEVSLRLKIWNYCNIWLDDHTYMSGYVIVKSWHFAFPGRHRQSC